MSASEILAKHPAPWRRLTHPNGVIQLFDAVGREVQLLDMVGFVESVTESWAARQATSAPAPAA